MCNYRFRDERKISLYGNRGQFPSGGLSIRYTSTVRTGGCSVSSVVEHSLSAQQASLPHRRKCSVHISHVLSPSVLSTPHIPLNILRSCTRIGADDVMPSTFVRDLGMYNDACCEDSLELLHHSTLSS